MSFNTMLASFTTILNRDDCTPAAATTFLQQGISRIQRDCRLPSMERSLIIVPAGVMNMLPAPTDLIQPIDFIYTMPDGRGRSLTKLSYRKLVELDPLDFPRAYARMQTQFWFAGAIPAGNTLQFFYYGNFSPFATADSDNELSASTPDLAVYAALSYAGDNFEMSQAAMWEGRYQAIKTEVIGMAIDLDAEGGPQSIQTIYEWDN